MGNRSFAAIILLLLMTVISVFTVYAQPSSKAGNELKVTVKLTHRSQESSKIIIVQGQVQQDGKGVPDALISIQLNDPHGGSIHIALTYSNDTGYFYDEFTLRGEIITGNYTLYLTASKVGYVDATVNIPFTLYSDFNLMISPKFLELEPGGLGNCTIEAVPGYPEEISLRIVSHPRFLGYRLNPTYINPGGHAILYLNASRDAAPGRYDIIIAGIADGKVREANFTLVVVEAEQPSNAASNMNSGMPEASSFYYMLREGRHYVILVLALSSIIISVLFIRFRHKRKGVDLSYMSAARAIAKIEELKAMGKIDDETYERLKREYESKL
ncbi:MAG: hypothetical protein ACP5K1_02120 [Candidatus Bathyarchaeia archaeon]